MAVTLDIVESWRRPRVVVRRLLGQGRSEPFAFTLLITGLILLWVSLAPFLAREAYFHPEQPLIQRLLAAALAMAATVPFWYLLAAVCHIVARIMGGKGSHYAARIALFWALVATAPALLVSGLVRGMIGLGAAANLTGLITALAFVLFWAIMLQEAERS